MIFAPSFLIVVWAQYGSSHFHWIVCDGDFRKGKGNRCELFSPTMTSSVFFGFLWMIFATGRIDQENVNARLTNTSMNVDDCGWRAIVLSRTLCSKRFCAISIKIRFTKRKDAVFKLRFLTQNRFKMRLKMHPLQLSTLLLLLSSYAGIRFLRGHLCYHCAQSGGVKKFRHGFRLCWRRI